ncbi:MAG: TonB-dependent receptor [candidate division NC10 bacterium]
MVSTIFKNAILTAALTGLLIGVAWAQENVIPLSEVVVTATRTKTPRSQLTKAVTVITKEDIKERQLLTVEEALREVPSLNVVRQGSIGSQTSVFLRGANSDQTLVLIDGVRIATSTTGGFNFADLTTDNIERIEVVRGPQSTLYGSDAIGGVINIITRKGEGKPRHNVTVEGGRHATFRTKLSSTGGFEFGDYSVTASYLDTDGFLDHDDYKNTSVSGNFGIKLGADAHLSLFSRYIDGDKNLPPVLGRGFDPNQEFKSKYYQGGGVLEQQVLPWLDYSLRMAVTRTDQKFSDPPDFRSPTSFTFSETDAQVLDFNGQVDVRPLPEVTITVGGEWSRQSADFSSDGAFSGFPFSSEFDEHTTDVAFFGQGELVLFEDRVILVGGGRVDDHSDFGTAVTGQFSGAFLIHETGTKFKGSWGTGFHAPDLADLFFPGFENPDLQPEEVESFEVGIEQVLWEDRFWLEVIYFDNDFTNLFQFNAATSRVENIAQASAKGVEISATVLPLPGLRVSGSYSRVDTEDEETGQDLLRRPQDTVFGQVTYTFLERATASVSVLYVGERADQDFTTFPSRRVTLDPYTKVDLALSVLLLEDQGILNKLQVKAKIDNLFDEDYEEAFGFPAPGLVYLFGVEATF